MTERMPGSMEPDVTCNAVRHKDGQLCRQPAGKGTDHEGIGRCRYHGGSSPAYGKHITARRLREEAVAIYGGRQNVNPFTALLEEVQWTAGHVQWLRERLAESEQSDDLLRTRKGWLSLYRSERKHLVFAAKVAVDAGVADRLLALAEREANQYVETIKAAAERAGLTATQWSELAREIAIGFGVERERAAIGAKPIDTTARETVRRADDVAEWADDDGDEPDDEPDRSTSLTTRSTRVSILTYGEPS